MRYGLLGPWKLVAGKHGLMLFTLVMLFDQFARAIQRCGYEDVALSLQQVTLESAALSLVWRETLSPLLQNVSL